MIGELTAPLQTSSMAVDVVNVTGIGLLLLYVYFHTQQKRAKKNAIKREWRRKSTATLVGFAFYAVVVATWGPSNTWIATVGQSINTNMQEFATELVLVGERPEQASGSDRLVGTVKTVGLVSYILAFAAVSISNSLVKKVASFVKNIP
ncbi:MAG: hypothetical protein ABEJ73_02715 [Haloplanus sp.]